MKITQYGFWEGKDVISHHYYDEKLFYSLLKHIESYKINSIIDLGCGKGDYVLMLKHEGYNVLGFDGNPYTKEITNGLCDQLYLHEPFNKDLLGKKADLVISLEVGEHIPKKYESVYIKNITSLAEKFLIVSWAIPKQGGYGHVNCKTNEYIINKIEKEGFEFDHHNTLLLREAAGFSWFKNTIMIFQKIKL